MNEVFGKKDRSQTILYMKSFGYSEEKIYKILSSRYLLKLNDNVLVKHMKEFNEYLISLGMREDEIINKTSNYCFLFCYNINNIEDKINNIRKLKLNDANILYILRMTITVLSLSVDTFNKKIEDMQQFGYTMKDVKKIICENPIIFHFSSEKLEARIKYLIDIGYDENKIIKIGKLFPSIYTMSEETILKMINNFDRLGFNKDEFIKISSNFPGIYKYKYEELENRINNFVNFGFDINEVHNMVLIFPNILGCPTETINKKLDDIVSIGYSKEEVIMMCINYPGIISSEINNLKDKINVFDMIGINSIVVSDTRQLIQSADLSYARYMFYLDKGINITNKNYRLLFIPSKVFEKRFDLTNEMVILKYGRKNNYEEVIRIRSK